MQRTWTSLKMNATSVLGSVFGFVALAILLRDLLSADVRGQL